MFSLVTTQYSLLRHGGLRNGRGIQDYLNNFPDDVCPWDAVFWRPKEVR